MYISVSVTSSGDCSQWEKRIKEAVCREYGCLCVHIFTSKYSRFNISGELVMQKSSMTTYNVCKYFNDNNIVLLTSWKCIIGVGW